MSKPRTPIRRRFLLAGIGALSGLVGGLGGQIVFVQGGGITTDASYSLPGVGMLVGVALAFVDLGEQARKAIKYVVVVGTIGVLVFGSLPPAVAQTCGADVRLDGRRVSLGSFDQPLMVDLREVDAIAVTPGAGVEVGTIEVAVASVSPWGALVDTDGTVLYFGEAGPDAQLLTLRVEQAGVTGFRIRAPEGWISPLLPLGTMEIVTSVNDTSTGVANTVCTETSWVRFVSRPVGTPTGAIGLGMSIVGFIGLGYTAASSSAGAVPERTDPDPSIRSERAVALAGHQFYDASGLPASEPLSVGQRYRLSIDVNLGAGVDDSEDSESMSVEGTTDDALDIHPTLTIGLGPIPLSLEFTPRRPGRQTIGLEFKLGGDLIGASAISVEIGEMEIGSTSEHDDDGDIAVEVDLRESRTVTRDGEGPA